MAPDDKNWSQEKRAEFMAYLGRHLVTLTGTYVALDGTGQPQGYEQPYNYSACVVSFESRWYLLTAGHAIKKFVELVDRRKILITGRVVADYFGVGAIDKHPIPFDIVDAPKVYIDDSSNGLDYALLELRDMERTLLAANGIKVFPLCVVGRPSKESFYRYCVVGFPTIPPKEALVSQAGTVSIATQAHCIPLARLTDDPTASYPRFHAQIVDMGDLESIVGMSGGPIFGFIDGGHKQDCYLLAVQSRWDRSKRIVYGCLIDSVCSDAADKLRNLGDPM